MNQPTPLRFAQSMSGVASAMLWGLFEVIALARSRWAMRRDRTLPSRGQRGA